MSQREGDTRHQGLFLRKPAARSEQLPHSKAHRARNWDSHGKHSKSFAMGLWPSPACEAVYRASCVSTATLLKDQLRRPVPGPPQRWDAACLSCCRTQSVTNACFRQTAQLQQILWRHSSSSSPCGLIYLRLACLKITM